MAISSLSETVAAALGRLLEGAPPESRLWVGYSGGVDSHVLLHLMARARDFLDRPLAAVHVDHGLHPASVQTARHCARVCAECGIDLHAVRLDSTPPRGASVEAWARVERYRAIARLLPVHGILLTAHHARDQAETFLLRALRGAGPDGLAAMSADERIEGVRVMRPLLSVAKADIDAYAHEHALSYLQDPLNEDERYDRNYLRTRVMPLLRARWPALDGAFARAARWQGEARLALRGLMRDELAALMVGSRLSVERLQALPAEAQRLALREWIRSSGYHPPSSDRLEQIRRSAARARADRVPAVVWEGAEVRRFAGFLHVMAPLPAAPASFVRTWRPGEALALPWGVLESVPVAGHGLVRTVTFRNALSVRLRAGGERCRPAGRAHSQSLKHALQERRVPPWERGFVPLIHSGDELIAAAGLFVCEGFEAKPGEPGWMLVWRR